MSSVSRIIFDDMNEGEEKGESDNHIVCKASVGMTSHQAGLSTLPLSVLLVVLQYADVASVVVLEQTCRYFREMLQQPSGKETDGENVHSLSANEEITSVVWKSFYYERFQNHSEKSLQALLQNNVSFKSIYVTRHLAEKSALKGLARLDSTTDETRLLYAITHFVSIGRDLIDLCWRVWSGKNQNIPQMIPPCEDPSKSSFGRMYARSFLRLLHCTENLKDMRSFLQLRRERNGSPVSLESIEPNPEDCSDLEHLMALVAKNFYDFSQTSMEDTMSLFIKTTLDALANEVRRRLLGALERSDRSILDAVHYVLFKDKGDGGDKVLEPFVGNANNYYSHRNSLLHAVLEERKGIPLSLAIVYQSVASRVGLKVDIIGLPGHIVARVPSLNCYVDVFARGELMTIDDCQRLVNQMGFAMNPAFLRPMIPELVILRVLNNLENALNREGLSSSTNRQGAVVTAMRAVLHRPEEEQLEECHRLIALTWVSDHVSMREDEWIEW